MTNVAPDVSSAIQWLNDVLDGVRQLGSFEHVPSTSKYWVDIPTGLPGVHYSIARLIARPNSIKVGIYFASPDEALNERLLVSLERHRSVIEAAIGVAMKWQNRKAGVKRRFVELQRVADLDDLALREWTTKVLMELQAVCTPLLRKIALGRTTGFLDIDGFAARLQAFSAARDWEQFHSPKNLASAIVVEAGELLEQFQWLTEEQSRQVGGDEIALARIADEVADVLIYTIRLADILGISIPDIIDSKIERNAAKYPIDKSKGRATKYTDL